MRLTRLTGYDPNPNANMSSEDGQKVRFAIAGDSPNLLPTAMLPQRVAEIRPVNGKISTSLIFLREFGAGEANRTPDPNLGKVMLYP